MKVINIVGARPNFVKIAPLIAEMRQDAFWQSLLVHTGQHYDVEMSADFFRDLDIPDPDVNLEVGSEGSGAQTGEIMKRLEPLLERERPDVVVVVGDVNSTLAGALAGVKLGLPVAHVEAGLRSFDRTMPEEINRVVTDAVADLLFATEPSAVNNLLNEGRPSENIFLVGNVMMDTLYRFLPSARRSSTLLDLGLSDNHGSGRTVPYVVVTLHRPALVDHGEKLAAILEPLHRLARELPVIFPVHPRTHHRLRAAGWASADGLLRTIPPLSYLSFLHLESEAALVITDSGGIQEETTVLGVPCLTVRENTERPITVTEGTNTIVGLDPQRLWDEAVRILSGQRKRGRIPDLWDGNCAKRIVKILREKISSRRLPR